MKSTSSFHRVGFTLVAHLYSQIVNVGVQLLLVPILLYAWGAERYGVWLLLSAIPTYLTFSDFGFTLTAKNEITIRVAKGDRHGALVTYQSVFMLLNAVAGAVILLAAVGLFSIHLGAHFDLGSLSETDAKLILFILGLNVIIYQYIMLLSAGVRGAGRPAAEVFLAATARLAGGAITVIIALLGGDLRAVAVSGLFTSLVFVGIFLLWLRSIAPWLRLGWSQATRDEVKRLFHPSISFMSQTLGQAFAISGPVIVLGMVANALDVVTFSTCRTLARLGTTATNTINSAIMPEYSRLFGLGNFFLLRRIALLQFGTALVISCIFFITLYLLGGWLLFIWTKGGVHLEQPFFTLLLLSVITEMLWTTIWIPLVSINRHVFIAHAYGVLASLGVAGGYFLAVRYGLVGIVIPSIFVNTVMIAIAVIQLSSRMPKLAEQPI